jgi:hypothetical protein
VFAHEREVNQAGAHPHVAGALVSVVESEDVDDDLNLGPRLLMVVGLDDQGARDDATSVDLAGMIRSLAG